MKTYVLVSQGVEIFRTTNKAEAYFIMMKENKELEERKMQFDDDEDYYVDNYIEIFEEH